MMEDSYDPFDAEKFDLRPEPPAPQPDQREGLPGWAMGALAQQNYYKPAAPGAFERFDDAQLEQNVVPDRGLPFGVTTPQEETYIAPDRAKAAVDMMVPQEPWEWGLAATGPAGRVAGKVGKAAALAAGVMGSNVDDAEAASIRKVLSATSHLDLARPNPSDFHRIASAKLRRPLSDIPFEATGSAPGSTLVTPSWLEGAVLTPLVGDPTVRGLSIKSIDNIPLSKPLETQGGHGYIRDTQGYANDGGLATTIGNRVRGLQQDFDTDRILGSYMKMGPQSGDFSHHNWGAVARMFPNAEIASKDVGRLNTAIRTEIANVPRTEAMIESGRQWNFPRFPGVQYGDLEQHLAENADPYRKAFLRALEKNRDIPGTPDVVAARYAVTDPHLLDAPAGASGLSMTQLTGDVVPGAHPDFPRHLTGSGNWTLGGSLRQEVMYPDIIERFDKTQPPDRWARKMYMAPDKGKLHGQLATPEWVDNTSQYMADTHQMGEVAAFDKYLRKRFGWSD
jgi:hypothetical protein